MSNYDEEPTFDDETPPEEEASNRTFLVAASALGGLVLLDACAATHRGGMSMPRKKRRGCNCPKWTKQEPPKETTCHFHG